MKILGDTNVFLDIILERHPFFEYSAKLLRMAPLKDIEIFVTATSITDLYYIVRKAKDRKTAFNFIKDLLNVIEVSAVVKIVVTRNKADFDASGLEIYTPEEFINGR